MGPNVFDNILHLVQNALHPLLFFTNPLATSSKQCATHPYQYMSSMVDIANRVFHGQGNIEAHSNDMFWVHSGNILFDLGVIIVGVLCATIRVDGTKEDVLPKKFV